MEEQIGCTDSERTLALQTVGFELWMMANASALLHRAQLTDEDPMSQNSFLDSAYLHARVLIAFFLKPRGYVSDIHQADFAPEWIPTPKGAVKQLDE